MEHNWETNKEMKNEEKTWEGCIHWTLVNYTPNQKWDKDIKRKVKQNQTWKVTVDSDSFLKKPVLAFGTDAWIIQDSDSHMLRLSESPTNIIFLPLQLFRKAAPSNLHQKNRSDIYKKVIYQTLSRRILLVISPYSLAENNRGVKKKQIE